MYTSSGIDLKCCISPFQKKRMESAEADIKKYKESLVNPGQHPSAKVELYVDPDRSRGKALGRINCRVSDKTEPYIPQELMEIHNRLADREERKILRTRAYSGFYTACHVFAYLGGRESLFRDEWGIGQKLCANMILGVLGFDAVYGGEGIDGVVMKPSDFVAEAPDGRPIVLEDTLAEVLRRFPVEGIRPDFSMFRGEKA